MTTTISPAEAQHFGQLAADWWNPRGSSAMLHKLNPVRLRFVRDAVLGHWQTEPRDRTPLAAKTALDVGCGAGLMCEPLARMGASVTGLDAAPENIAVAKRHAREQQLPIEYVCQDVAQFGGAFDLVTSMEVIEHVSDPGRFVAALAARLAPDGLLILSTPNRTPQSRLGMVTLGEGLGFIPKGTHNWDQFLTPEEATELLEENGLHIVSTSGLSFSPSKGFILSEDKSLNYLIAATFG